MSESSQDDGSAVMGEDSNIHMMNSGIFENIQEAAPESAGGNDSEPEILSIPHIKTISGDPVSRQSSDMSDPEMISSNNGADSDELMSKSSVLVPPLSDLPSTVTYLEGPNGSQVYIVGTAHFSEESNEDVIKTLELVKPHIVCLELCRNRLHVIKCTEEEIMDEVQNIGFAKMKELLSRSGLFYGLFQLSFLHLSAGLTKQLKLAPGGEFRAAYNKGKELGCNFKLSDRSIQITLRRAIYSLTIAKQLGLAVKLLFNNEKVTKSDVESFKGDLLEKLIKEIAGEYPNLSRIFVDERDQYLSSMIYEAAKTDPATLHRNCQYNSSEEDSDYSPEEEQYDMGEKTKIVAVVGIGHIAGIKKYWGHKIDIEAICVVPEPSIQGRILGKSIKYLILGLILYGGYKGVSLTCSALSPYIPYSNLIPTWTSLYNSVTSLANRTFST